MTNIEKIAEDVVKKHLDVIETALENAVDPVLLEYHTALLECDKEKADRLKAAIEKRENDRKELEEELMRLHQEVRGKWKN